MFFTSADHIGYTLWSCQNECDSLSYLFDNIYIRFGYSLYRQIVGIPMGTNCAPLVADLFLFCYERAFMTSLSNDNQAYIIGAFNSTSRRLNKANTSDTKAPILDLYLFISNGFVSSKIYDKRDYFDFDIVHFPFSDGDVPHPPSYGVYISQIIRFAKCVVT